MSITYTRLKNVERLPIWELALRGMGIAALYVSWKVVLQAHRLIAAGASGHEGRCYGLAAVAFLFLTLGLALTLFGPGLLRHVEIPWRSRWFPHKTTRRHST